MPSGKPTPQDKRKRLRKQFVEGRFSVRSIAKICDVSFSTAYREWELWKRERDGGEESGAMVAAT